MALNEYGAGPLVGLRTNHLTKLSTTLGRVASFLEATDQANAEVNMADAVRYRPLTTEVVARWEELQQIIDGEEFTEAASA